MKLQDKMESKLRKFECLVNEKGLEDGGQFSFVFEVDSLVKGKIYTQADQRFYDENTKNSEPFIVDGSGCSRDIEFMLKTKKIKEIFES